MNPSILNLGAVWRRVGKYTTRPLYPTELTRYQLKRRRIGFRALLEGLEKRKISCFCRYSNQGPSRRLNAGSCNLLRIIVRLQHFALLKIIVRLGVRPIRVFCHKLYSGVMKSPQPDQEGNKLQRPNSNFRKPPKNNSEVCPSNQAFAAAMTSASDEK